MTRVTDRQLEARAVPHASYNNYDTVEQTLYRTVNDYKRMLINSEIQGWTFDQKPYLEAIARLIEIWKKPVEVYME